MHGDKLLATLYLPMDMAKIIDLVGVFEKHFPGSVIDFVSRNSTDGLSSSRIEIILPAKLTKEVT